MLNIWKQFPKGGYYLNHPVRFIRHLFRPFKWAWQRVTRGYADCDLWDMDRHLIKLLPQMLKQLSVSAKDYPQNVHLSFASATEWSDYLKNIAEHFMNADEDFCPQKNEYAPMFSYCGVTETKHPDGTVSVVSNAPEELRKNYWNRIVEINQWREREVCKALEMLAPVFFALWG